MQISHDRQKEYHKRNVLIISINGAGQSSVGQALKYGKNFYETISFLPGINIDLLQELQNTEFQIDMCLIIIQKLDQVKAIEFDWYQSNKLPFLNGIHAGDSQSQGQINPLNIRQFQAIDNLIKKVNPKQILMVINKCSLKCDNIESVREWYKDVYQQARCKNLPEHKLPDKMFCLLYQQLYNRNQIITQYIAGQFRSQLIPLLRPPYAPISLKNNPETTTDTVIKLTWANGGVIVGGKAVIDYAVSYDQGTDNYVVLDSAVPNQYYTTVVYLTPGKTYEFKVTARNKAGSSLDSVKVSILAARVPDAPIYLANDPVLTNDHQISLTWIEGYNGGSAVTDYQVSYAESTNNVYNHDLTGSLQTSYIITGLKADTTYKFKVLAINIVGCSQDSMNVSIHTARVPDAPINLSNDLAVTKAHQIRLKWKEGHYNGGSAVTGYKVSYAESTNNDYKNVLTGSLQTSYIIKGLKADTTYQFKVLAINNVGCSQDSSIVTIKAEQACKPHVLWIGNTGVGKSSISQACYYNNYDDRFAKKFLAQRKLVGVTQTFNTEYSKELDCFITDTPGLRDENFPTSEWINLYNKFVVEWHQVDFFVIVQEDNVRVGQLQQTTYDILQLICKNIQWQQLLLIFNKSDKEAFCKKSAQEWYKEAIDQFQITELPESMRESNILAIEKESIGRKKNQKLEEKQEKTNNLIKQMKKKIIPFLTAHIKLCNTIVQVPWLPVGTFWLLKAFKLYCVDYQEIQDRHFFNNRPQNIKDMEKQKQEQEQKFQEKLNFGQQQLDKKNKLHDEQMQNYYDDLDRANEIADEEDDRDYYKNRVNKLAVVKAAQVGGQVVGQLLGGVARGLFRK